ncbi:MAG: MFS transporter [Planctomycetes bacterium]|nr:MFS transporter [Planctomycetota bacterium]
MNQKRLFVASCIALVATAMHFAVRGDVMGTWETDFVLSKAQIGWIIIGGFWGFTAAMVVGGPLCDFLGMRNIMWIAFGGHLVGGLLTIFAPSGIVLCVATWIIGLANGFVEAAINPLVATIYPDRKTHKLTVLHAWFPGGIVIGGLACLLLSKIMGLGSEDVTAATQSLSWKIKIAVILIPTIVYGVMLLGQKFPKTERVQAGVSTAAMFKEAFVPLFIVVWICMWLTAASELGPNQWIPNLFGAAGLPGILVLVYITTLMGVLRFFGGALAHKLSPVGLLWCCSILTAIGLFAMSYSRTGLTVLVSATIFSVGITFYWPTMLGITSERFPKGGAFLLAVMGGTGMLSAGIAQPAMGWVNDHYTLTELSTTAPQVAEMAGQQGIAVLTTLTDAEQTAAVDAARLVGASMTFRWVTILPIILLVLYGAIYIRDRAAGGYKAEKLAVEQEGQSKGAEA